MFLSLAEAINVHRAFKCYLSMLSPCIIQFAMIKIIFQWRCHSLMKKYAAVVLEAFVNIFREMLFVVAWHSGRWPYKAAHP